jgi:hypothetical protein
MLNDQKIRDLTIKIIQVLVWFEILWASVFLIGTIFQWSGLTQQISTAFFGSGFCALIVLASLVLLNITSNLNIISKTQIQLLKPEAQQETSSISFIKIIGIAAGLIALIVGSLWIAELRLYKQKVFEASTKLESIADAKLLNEASQLIKTDGKIHELDKIREALSANIQSGSSLSLVFPIQSHNIDIFYELHAWWYAAKDKNKISEANLPKFIPTPKEQKNWDKLLSGKISSFTSVQGNTIRAFKRTVTENGIIILLIDTSRRSDYSRSSFEK